jgi:hypothetical protein
MRKESLFLFKILATVDNYFLDAKGSYKYILRSQWSHNSLYLDIGNIMKTTII